MFFGEDKESYLKRDPENLSVFLIYVIVASNISLFLFLSKHESPYKSISFLTLSEKDWETDFTLFTAQQMKISIKDFFS